MSTTKTPQQLHNLREALEVWWPSVPEANVYPCLRHFSKNESTATDCGTVACFGGWAARWPGIAAQGVKLSSYGVPMMRDGNVVGFDVARVVFGDRRLFSQRGMHEADEGFTGSDHALVTNRLRWALEH